jgi:hypothetical protein
MSRTRTIRSLRTAAALAALLVAAGAGAQPDGSAQPEPCAAALGAARDAGARASYTVTGSSGAKGGTITWLPADPASPGVFARRYLLDVRWEWQDVEVGMTCEDGSAMLETVRTPRYGVMARAVPAREVLRFPLTVGESWLYTGSEVDEGFSAGAGTAIVAANHVLSLERIETPAGAFDTFVVQTDESRDGYTRHITEWIAMEPCFMVVRRVVTTWGGLESPDEDWRLESYSCGEAQ